MNTLDSFVSWTIASTVCFWTQLYTQSYLCLCQWWTPVRLHLAAWFRTWPLRWPQCQHRELVHAGPLFLGADSPAPEHSSCNYGTEREHVSVYTGQTELLINEDAYFLTSSPPFPFIFAFLYFSSSSSSSSHCAFMTHSTIQHPLGKPCQCGEINRLTGSITGLKHWTSLSFVQQFTLSFSTHTHTHNTHTVRKIKGHVVSLTGIWSWITCCWTLKALWKLLTLASAKRVCTHCFNNTSCFLCFCVVWAFCPITAYRQVSWQCVNLSWLYEYTAVRSEQ